MIKHIIKANINTESSTWLITFQHKDYARNGTKITITTATDTMFNHPFEIVGIVFWSLSLPVLPVESLDGCAGSDGDGFGCSGFSRT